LSFHIGTGIDPKVYRGPGAGITNHVVSFYGAQTTGGNFAQLFTVPEHPAR
jgi:hypothetical protein